MMRDIGDPRDSDGKTSATILGLRTFAATAQPVRNREKMSNCTFCDSAVITMPAMKKTLATLKTRYRPQTSENGAMTSGPAASPSSQIVTKSVA